jgi:hypothetical protein
MATENLEERIDRLEKTALNAQKMARHACDVQEISNLMGRQVYLHEAGRDPEFPETLFARNTPGISWEVAFCGKWIDEGIRKPLDWHTNYPIGSMFEHTLASPVIEVAGDGKTAKGVWMSPGHETNRNETTGKLQAWWCWSKYGCDFVKEDGVWKLWHYHVYRVFRTPFEKSWVEYNELEMTGTDKKRREGQFGKPDLPTTYDHPYSKDTLPELVPEPPVPYETFDPAKAY